MLKLAGVIRAGSRTALLVGVWGCLGGTLHAQTVELEWTFDVYQVATIGDPASYVYEARIGDSGFNSIAPVCGPKTGDTGMSLYCWWAVQPLAPGTHEIEIRAKRKDVDGFAPLPWMPFEVIQVTVADGCPYTNPTTGVSEIKPVGYVITGPISRERLKARRAQLEADGWWVQRTGRTATGVTVDALCVGL
jgi:hypothetical protein